MAQDKGIRKDEEADLVKQSTVTISLGHFCTLFIEIVQCVFWLLSFLMLCL